VTQGDASAVESDASMPLKPHAATDHEPGKSSDGLRTAVTVGASLAIVLGAFFLFAWMMRRASPGGMGTLPVEAFEVVGRASLANRQQVQLLRCGNRLLLVAVGHSASGGRVQTLTEITDPQEVNDLLRLCHPNRVATAKPRSAVRKTEGRDE
jgi:flagellar biogenesis protein FliO